MKMCFKKSIIRFGLSVVVAIILAACGNNEKSEERNNVENENVTTDVVTDVHIPSVSDVSFKGEDGSTVSVSSLKGKVVFINFWATWCPPCIHELPSINELKKSFDGNDDIVFLMVDLDNKMEESTAFMKEHGYDLPVSVPASNIPSDYLGNAIPTTVILDKNGNMVDRMEGARDYTAPEIVQAMNDLVGSN